MVHELTFSHFVIATSDGTTFASARDSHNRVHNFLISKYGDIKRQNRTYFEPVTESELNPLRKRIETYYSKVPTYRVRTINFN